MKQKSNIFNFGRNSDQKNARVNMFEESIGDQGPSVWTMDQAWRDLRTNG